MVSFFDPVARINPNKKRDPMKHSKTLLLIAAMFGSSFAFAVEAPKAAAVAPHKGACCVKADKAGSTCAHPCCVEATKANKNCEKCGGTNAVEAKK